MRSALRRMDVRLFLSHAVVALIGVVAVALVVRFTAPGIFDAEMRRRGMASGVGRAAGDAVAARDSLLGALNIALAIGVAVALVAAAVLALVATRRVMEPLDAVRDATRKLAEGTYSVEVPVPAVTELSGLAQDVNRLGAALAETEQRRAALVSDLAHELRTPLTTVRGFLEGLTDGVFEPTPDVLADLTEEVARLQRLVGDLNVLSRADEGALPLDLARHDVAEVAVAVVGRLAPQFADKGVELGVDAPVAVFAAIDRDRVTQLLTNVVGNALAYTGPGGRVTVAVRREGEQVTVEVADTGRGIAADELPRVFDRFRRADRSGSGTGIGLTIARSVARAHGGDVTARSAGLGEGSTFVVRLPAGGPVEGPAGRPSPSGTPDAPEGP
jgi:signal transduction histidine kinase